MARRKNYAFDRNNRAKAKAAKREAKRQAKLAARTQKTGVTSPADSDPDSPAGAAETQFADDGNGC